jgi:hypothetical protein
MILLSHWFIQVTNRQISRTLLQTRRPKEYLGFRCDVVSSLILFSLVFLQLACGTCECMEYTCRAQPEAGRFSTNQSPGMYRAVRFLESFLTDVEYGLVWCYSLSSPWKEIFPVTGIVYQCDQESGTFSVVVCSVLLWVVFIVCCNT